MPYRTLISLQTIGWEYPNHKIFMLGHKYEIYGLPDDL